MRFSRVPCLVAPMIFVALLMLAPAWADDSAPTRLASDSSPYADPNLDFDLELTVVFRCEDEAEAADNAWGELLDAEFAQDVICDVYGLFSGECGAAVVYTGYKQLVFSWAVDDFEECWNAV